MSREEHKALVVTLGELLVQNRAWLVLAESCTGGMLGEWITAVPGSSAYFLGGVVSYHDLVKERVLGVAPELIRTYGAVSAECALAMARGARELVGSDIALSITGVAGPGGGTVAKPVGITFIALSTARNEYVEQHQWSGTRQENREQSAQAALNMLINYLGGESKD
jgi:PncC family amidohydrolase